jgi:hypothetical protein
MLAQSVADSSIIIVVLSGEGIDRVYLNVYMPQLQSEQGIVHYFREHRGQPLPSAALMSQIARSFVAALDRYIAQNKLPLVPQGPAQRRCDES